MELERETEFYYNWFKKYVSSFYCKDDNINRKLKDREEHTLRVLTYCRDLVSSIDTDEDISELLPIIALFHDIGRFKQFTTYGTFNDKESEDHADLGIRILEESNILSPFSKRKVHLILNAIRLHNKKDLYKKSKDSKLILLTKLIRKADKSDILRTSEKKI